MQAFEHSIDRSSERSLQWTEAQDECCLETDLHFSDSKIGLEHGPPGRSGFIRLVQIFLAHSSLFSLMYGQT